MDIFVFMVKRKSPLVCDQFKPNSVDKGKEWKYFI